MKKATQPRNKTRRKKAPLWKVSLRKGRVPFVLLLITLGLIWLKSQNVLDKGMTLVHNSIVNLSEKAGFIIEGILIEGRNKTEKEQIYTALNRKKGDSILLCDPSEIKDNLERLPWVRSAMVQRRLPDTLYIRLSERKPLALWQSKKKLSLLDDRGLTMDTIPVSPFRHLPIIIGEGSAEKAPKFLEVVLKVPFMKKKLKAAVYVDKRRWNLHLSNEVLVKLPEENFADALQSLVAMEENQKLGTRDISVVDLRFLPHVVLQMKDKIPARPNSRKPGIGKSRGKEA